MFKEGASICIKIASNIAALTLKFITGNACAYDRILSTLQGVEAVNAVLRATADTPSPVISIIENKIIQQKLADAVKATHEVAKAIAQKDFDGAMRQRSAEFSEYYDAYMTTTATDQPKLQLPANKARPTPL